jgi:hypothetical protein
VKAVSAEKKELVGILAVLTDNRKQIGHDLPLFTTQGTILMKRFLRQTARVASLKAWMHSTRHGSPVSGVHD